MSSDPRIDAYIASQADFARPILACLRETLHAAELGLVETIKWNMPFFLLEGRPFANMAAFKAHASFGFWKARARTGREPEAMGQFGRLTTVDAMPPREDLIAAIRAQAIAAKATPAPRARAPRGEAEVPSELAAALARDDAARATFASFPPSCRRDYCDWIAEAKRAETREQRIAQTIVWLGEGKRRTWKYEAC